MPSSEALFDAPEASCTPAIAFEDVSRLHQRGDVTVAAVDRVSCRIDEGESIAVVGPSGSGKSTLLHLMGGLDTPTSGFVTVAGHDLASLSDRELTSFRHDHIGFVFQFFNLLPAMSAWENVALPALVTGARLSSVREQAHELLDQVGLGDRRAHRPSELSGGQLQRVAIARALLLDPPVILADEPTGNLDSRSAAEVLELLHALRSPTRTLVIVTHDEAVASSADRTLAMLDGVLQQP